MYNINTGQARTDLYGIGKGLAQVVDLSPMREQSAINQQLAAQEKAAKQKQEQGREDEILNNLAVASKIAIRPNDQKYFAEQQQGLYDYVTKNIDKLRSGDAGAMMEFQRMYGKLNTEAEISKNAREFAEAEFQKYNANPSKYRVGSEKKIGDFLAAPEYAGNWDTSTIPLKEKVDYMSRINSVLSPIVDDIMVKTPLKSKFEENEAMDMIKQDIMSDPLLIDNANYEFENASDQELKSLGLTRDADPVEYAANKYKKYLTRDVTGRDYYTGFNGGGSQTKKPNVAGVYSTNKDGDEQFQFEYTNTSDNPYVSIPDPNNPGKTIEVKPYKVTGLQDRNAKLVALTKPAVAGEQGKQIVLNYNDVSDIMHNKFGIENVYNLRSEKTTPENVQVKRQKTAGTTEGKKEPAMSQADWNKKWSSLKKGESMKGLDGKTYTKK